MPALKQPTRARLEMYSRERHPLTPICNREDEEDKEEEEEEGPERTQDA